MKPRAELPDWEDVGYISPVQKVEQLQARIERMEAVVEAARSLTAHKFGNLPPRSFYMLREALIDNDTAEAIARGEISPDEAALVDETDE